jgi:hypothetical protein
MAYPWSGLVTGGVVHAKVIGQLCPGVLKDSEVAELDAYLAKAAPEWDADPHHVTFTFDTLVRDLSEGYVTEYRDPHNAGPPACSSESVEEARETLERVRAFMKTGGPVFGRK